MKTMLFVSYGNRETSPCSGSAVRPVCMEKAFQSLGYRVISLWGEPGTQERARQRERFWQALKKENPLFCYVEGPSGPVRDLKEYRLLHRITVEKQVPLGWFYRDAACFYPEVWQGRSWLEKSKQPLVRAVTTAEQQWLRRQVTTFFVPTESFGRARGLFPFYPLPPGCPPLRAGFYPGEPKGNRCIYVGGVSRRYGTDLMLRAFEKLNRQGTYSLTVVCRQGEEAFFAPFLGAKWLTVRHDTPVSLPALYAQHDLALYPLRPGAYQKTVFSVKIPEYLAGGLPIAAIRCGETARFLETWGVGRCCDDGEEAFAKLVQQMLSQREEYKRMTERIPLCVQENQWDHRARQAASVLLAMTEKRNEK